MQNLTRITRNTEVMGGKPCIRGMWVTLDTIVGLMASGHTFKGLPEIKLSQFMDSKRLLLPLLPWEFDIF